MFPEGVYKQVFLNLAGEMALYQHLVHTTVNLFCFVQDTYVSSMKDKVFHKSNTKSLISDPFTIRRLI